MSKNELANFIAEFIENEKEFIIDALDKKDISIIRDEAYEYIDNCVD